MCSLDYTLLQARNSIFGERVRSLRETQGIGLREFAKSIGISPTYLSKIERGELVPPIEDKVRAMAKALGQNEDELLALTGRLSADLPEIIRKQPREMAAFLRAAKDLPPAKINRLTREAAKMRRAITEGTLFEESSDATDI